MNALLAVGSIVVAVVVASGLFTPGLAAWHYVLYVFGTGAWLFLAGELWRSQP